MTQRKMPELRISLIIAPNGRSHQDSICAALERAGYVVAPGSVANRQVALKIQKVAKR